MLRRYLDLLLRRAGPADLPASPRVLGGTVLALLAVQAAAAAATGQPAGEMLPGAVASSLLTLGWIWCLLRLYGHPARFLQTATALFGVTLLATPVLVPLAASALGGAGAATPATMQLSLPLLLFVALGLYMLVVEARILAAALEQHAFLCALLVLAGEFLIALVVVSLGLVPAAAGAAAQT